MQGTVVTRRNPAGQLVYGIRWTDQTGKDTKRFSRSWTKQQAKAELASIERKLRAGVATADFLTVDELYHEWLANHIMVNCSPAYMCDVQIQYRHRIQPMIGHRRIDTVNKRVIKQMVAQMKAVMREGDPVNEYAGHRTINKTLTAIKSMFTYAVEIEQIERNPAHGVPALEEAPTRQIDAWPLEVVHRIALASLHREDRKRHAGNGRRAPWASERDYALIMLAALTGLRKSELLALHWDRVEGDWLHVTQKLCNRSFTLRQTKSKRGVRRVPLVPLAREILDAWRTIGAHDTIVFPNHAGADHMRAHIFDRDVWKKSRNAVGTIKHQGRSYDCRTFTFHELRHTFVSLCLAAGRDLWEVAHWAGDDPEMLKRIYGHYIPDSLGDTGRLNRVLSVSRRELPARAPVAALDAG